MTSEKILSTANSESNDHRTIPHLDDNIIGKRTFILSFRSIKKGNIII